MNPFPALLVTLSDHNKATQMSIFGKIKTAIFGKDGGPFGDNYFGQKKAETTTQTKTVPVQIPTPQTPVPTATPAAPAPATPQAPVDVVAVLTGIAQQKGNPALNWKTSIVDLMKLLDLDSSLDNRKELATELGYTGAKDGSAEMNIWLHKAVMRELAANGGTVPADLKD